MNNEQIKKVYELKQQKANLEDTLTKLKTAIDDLDKEIDENTSAILNDILAEGLETYKHPTEDIIVTLASTSSTAYKDEDAVIKYLLEHNPSLVKTTYKIDKKSANKELKTNAVLKESLDSFLETKVTKYVVITNEENTEKREQHILENLAKKEK